MVNFGHIFGKKTDIEVLPLSADQSNSVADLHGKLFRRGWDSSECDQLISQNNVFGFYSRPTNDENILGFVLTRIAADEAEILSIGTDEKAQNIGLGWRMMRAAMSEASNRGASKLFLEVDEKNAPALNLYRKIGFLTVGERRAYYDDGENKPSNALVLELKLT